jgi:phosphoglycerol transferase MdoB-like AlkP superfamily enzyme
LFAKRTNEHKKSPLREGFFVSGRAWWQYLLLIVFWFLCGWLARGLFLWHTAALYQRDPGTLLWQAFFSGWWLDLSTAVYIALATYIVLVIFHFRTKPGITFHIFFWLFGSLFFLLALADAELMLKWGNRINEQALQYMEHPQEAAAASAGAPFGSIAFKWIMALVLAWFLHKGFVNLGNKCSVKPGGWKLALAWTVTIALSALAMRGGTGAVPLNQSSVAFSNATRLNILAVNPLWNLGYYLGNGTRKLDYSPYLCCDSTAEQAAKIWAYPTDTARLQLTELAKPNILLIVLESFTAQASRYFDGKLNLTPNLDAIAAESFALKRLYANGDRTDKGLASLLSGWHPQPWHSVLHEPEKAARLPSFPLALRKAGYTSVFHYGGDSRFADMKAWLLAIGTDQIEDIAVYPAAMQNSKWGAHDEHLFQRLAEQLPRYNQPWFCTALTLSSHEPFEIPGKMSEGDEMERFRASISYTDSCLGTWWKRIRQEPWFRNTLVIITADHGRAIGLDLPHHFHPDLYRIPMIIGGGALNAKLSGKIETSVLSHAHLAPNVLRQLNMSGYDQFQHAIWFGNKNKPAMYAFQDGIGWIGDSARAIWENKPWRRTLIEGDVSDVEQAEQHIRAYQQLWINFFRRL